MGHDDRFRGQDRDYEYADDDETSDEFSMRQDQGGRPPAQDDGYSDGRDGFPSSLTGGGKKRRGTRGRQEDEFGRDEADPQDDDTDGGGW
ncbi:MAG: hypothetical protein ACRDNL_28750 [Spirillospora sp.]